jgi:hypothetical protein
MKGIVNSISETQSALNFILTIIFICLLFFQVHDLATCSRALLDMNGIVNLNEISRF